MKVQCGTLVKGTPNWSCNISTVSQQSDWHDALGRHLCLKNNPQSFIAYFGCNLARNAWVFSLKVIYTVQLATKACGTLVAWHMWISALLRHGASNLMNHCVNRKNWHRLKHFKLETVCPVFGGISLCANAASRRLLWLTKYAKPALFCWCVRRCLVWPV